MSAPRQGFVRQEARSNTPIFKEPFMRQMQQPPTRQHSSNSRQNDHSLRPENKLARRSFLAAAATAAAGAALSRPALSREYGPNAPVVRYPDPDIIVLDNRFEKIKIGNS